MKADVFWNTDLKELESSFFPKGVKVTNFSSTLDNRVPHQGSILLDRAVNIENFIKKPSVIKRLIFRITRFIKD